MIRDHSTQEDERDELGASQRPDGIAIAESLEVLKARIKEWEKLGSPDCFVRYSQPIELFVDPKVWKKHWKTAHKDIVHVKELGDDFFKKAGGITWKTVKG